MEPYILIFLLQLSGFGLQVFKKLIELDNKLPDDGWSDIWNDFIKKDKLSFGVFGLVLFIQLVFHYIIGKHFPGAYDGMVVLPVVEWEIPAIIVPYVIALLLGFFGQWFIYKVFGRAEQYVNDKLGK